MTNVAAPEDHMSYNGRGSAGNMLKCLLAFPSWSWDFPGGRNPLVLHHSTESSNPGLILPVSHSISIQLRMVRNPYSFMFCILSYTI